MFKESVISFLYFLVLVISVLISVAFLSLFERKLLGYIQLRKGPNKTGVSGMLQPFSDVIKLFTKESVWLISANLFLFFLSPFIMMLTAVFLWAVVPTVQEAVPLPLGFVMFLCVVGVGTYPLLLSGWASNSKYAFLGSLRGVAQMVTYEISMMLITLCIVFMVSSYDLNEITTFQVKWPLVNVTGLLGICWLVSCVVEMNRAPFDFAEGESELVSGFNVEYSGGPFAMIFLSEYSMLLVFSSFTSLLFMGLSNGVGFGVSVMILSGLMVWMRGTLTRYRFDLLMSFGWKAMLPVCLVSLMLLTMITNIS